MIKFVLYLIIAIFLFNCSMKNRVDHHGVHLLEKKSKELIMLENNKNDIIQLLGPPSVISTFDNDLLFYIERKITTGSITKMGKKKFLKNDVLILEINNRGILTKMDFYDLKRMKNLKIVSSETSVDYQKNNFIYDFLSSMRQKVNDPLGKRNKN